MLGVVDLHGRTGREAGTAADALALIHLQGGLTIDHGRADGRHRAPGDHRGPLTHIGYQIVVDLGRLGVLHIDGDVPLTTTVDLAAGSGDMHPVGHGGRFELVDELVHHGFDDPGGVGARDVAVQPALGVGDHGHRVLGAAHDEAGVFDRLDQGLHLGGVLDHVFEVRTQGKVDEAVGVPVADVTQLAQGEDIEDPLGADLDGPDLVTTVGHMSQHPDLWVFVVLPHAEILAHHGMQVLPGIRASGFDRLTHICHRLPPKS